MNKISACSANLLLRAAAVILFSLLTVFVINPGKTSTVKSEPPTVSDYANLGEYRSVMQIINTELYHWFEYENKNTGSYFIYQVSPFKKPLNPVEVELLFSKSRQWRSAQPQISLLSSNNDDYLGNAAQEIQVELPADAFTYNNDLLYTVERMEDNRTELTAPRAVEYPFYTIGYLEVVFPHATDANTGVQTGIRATGFLINPHTIITNAHCLYANYMGGYFESAKLYPAQYAGESGIIQPFGSISTSGYDIPKEFIDLDDLRYTENDDSYMIEAVKHDLAALFTETPVEGISTFMPIEFNLSGNPVDISLAGYPGTVRGINSDGFWLSEGDTHNSDDYLLKYNAYTSKGNSGSPVFYFNEQASDYRLIAVNSFILDDQTYSGGPYFNTNNQDMVTRWLQYTPDDTNNDDNNIIDDDNNGEPDPVTEPDETVEVEQPILGDVNGDGDINIHDVVLTIRHALEIEFLSGGALERADVNGDDEINILDVTLIMRFSLGLIESF